jgi:hypothetical protein
VQLDPQLYKVGGLDPWGYGGREEHVEVAAGKVEKIVTVFGSVGRIIQQEAQLG